jgi:hypothetical protein
MSWEGKCYIPLVEPAALNREWSVPRVDGVVPLRPLGVGNILGGTFKAVRFNAPVTFGLTFAVILVTQIVPLALTLVLGFRALDSISWYEMLGGSSAPGSLLGRLGLAEVVSVVVAFLSMGMGQVLAQVFVTHAVFQSVTARRPTVAETWRAAAGRIGPCLAFVVLSVGGVTLVYCLVTVAAVGLIGLLGGSSDDAMMVLGVVLVLALAAAACFLFVRLFYALPAIVVERLGPVAAAKRSWRLSRGLFWRTIGLFALSTWLINAAAGTMSQVGWLVSLPLAIWTPEAAMVLVAPVLITLLSAIISVPLTSSVWTLIYVDARIRREGLDITLAEELWS